MILLIITTIAALLILLFLPKNISTLEIYTTLLFASFLGSITDMYLDVNLDLYGFFGKGVDWEYLPILLFIYPAWVFVFLNYYPYQKSALNRMVYIIGWSLLTILFESLSLYIHVFYYNGWKLIYSALCYPVIYYLLVLHVKLIRKMQDDSSHVYK